MRASGGLEGGGGGGCGNRYRHLVTLTAGAGPRGALEGGQVQCTAAAAAATTTATRGGAGDGARGGAEVGVIVGVVAVKSRWRGGG